MTIIEYPRTECYFQWPQHGGVAWPNPVSDFISSRNHTSITQQLSRSTIKSVLDLAISVRIVQATTSSIPIWVFSIFRSTERSLSFQACIEWRCRQMDSIPIWLPIFCQRQDVRAPIRGYSIFELRIPTCVLSDIECIFVRS